MKTWGGVGIKAGWDEVGTASGWGCVLKQSGRESFLCKRGI